VPILAHYTFILPFRVFPCSLEPEKSVLIHDVTLRVHPRRHVFNLVSTTPRFHHPLCLRARPLGLTSLLGASSSCPSSGTPPLLAAPGLYFLSDEHCHTTLVLPSLASYVVVCTAHYRPAPVDLRAVHVVSSWYVKTLRLPFPSTVPSVPQLSHSHTPHLNRVSGSFHQGRDPCPLLLQCRLQE